MAFTIRMVVATMPSALADSGVKPNVSSHRSDGSPSTMIR
jgi:hypothetical protein